ncbi:MAG: hypothetical protein A2Y95_08880 [Deltaproteobacteria bacterium RBG_13_65_10]|nr:MAG: hypothetical protein A2Y95_08880 [Deltaproteobacteria bacterium RBG_13_65_10]
MHEDLIARLALVRQRTLDLLNGLEDTDLTWQPHSAWSPVGWHLGHIAYTEAYWILTRCAGDTRLAGRFGTCFSTTAVPKDHRSAILPSREAIETYLRDVRGETCRVLERLRLDDDHPLLRRAAIVHMVIQHEAQHLENIRIVLYLRGAQKEAAPVSLVKPPAVPDDRATVHVPGGTFTLGAPNEGSERCYDNERSAHPVELPDFRIELVPVTNRRFLQFIEAGGYETPALWSEEGRAWLGATKVRAPQGWERREGAWIRRGFCAIAPVVPEEPVIGVCAHEADAFARFEGRRLPSEAQWERAATWDAAPGRKRLYAWGNEDPDPARANHDGANEGPTPVGNHPAGASALGCHDLHGNVWEWTASLFAPYPGFKPFAYEGYSSPYFDGRHRVLRGGSWATSPEVLRATFRNWYLPHVREIFAGFRCAVVGE